MRIAVFLSGRGSNFLSIVNAIKNGKLNAEIVLVASNKAEAKGLEKADDLGYRTKVFNRSEFDDGRKFADCMIEAFDKNSVDYIVLAGYLRKMPPRVIKLYENKIINIHPALLPKFGGKGMYGINVHKKVIEAQEKVTGVTVHFVDDKYDHGEIISQSTIPVLDSDTPDSLAARVLELEHTFYPEVLQFISRQSK